MGLAINNLRDWKNYLFPGLQSPICNIADSIPARKLTNHCLDCVVEQGNMCSESQCVLINLFSFSNKLFYKICCHFLMKVSVCALPARKYIQNVDVFGGKGALFVFYFQIMCFLKHILDTV